MALEMIELKTNNVNVEPPKPWVIDDDSKGLFNIDADHVISFLDEGRPLTFYKDDVWDLSPYGGGSIKKNKLYFDNIVSSEDRELIKRLVFVMLMVTKGKDGLVKAPATLNIFYRQ